MIVAYNRAEGIPAKLRRMLLALVSYPCQSAEHCLWQQTQAKRLLPVDLFEGTASFCEWEHSHVLFFTFHGLSL